MYKRYKMSSQQNGSTSNGTQQVRVSEWKGESYRMDLGKDNPNYGTPHAGTKSDRRGRKAAVHVANEILDLCEVIYRIGMPYPGCVRAVPFGHLFQIYTKISDKVVGMLIRARRHGLVHFKGEMLYQGQDDDKIVMLLEIPEPLFEVLGLEKPANGQEIPTNNKS